MTETQFNPIGDQNKEQALLKDLSHDEIIAMNWYYQMELKPGSLTGGFNRFTNMIPTQRVLERVKVDGLRALDLGAMEGAFAVMLDRAGASVDLYDRLDLSDRIRLVEEAYDCNFNYMAGLPFHDFAENHVSSGADPYDFVLFSGVLYHVIEPMLFLHQIKSMMRPGSLMVMETSLIPDEECCLYFNQEGRFYKGSNYYQVTSSWLDYSLRLLGFKIHSVEYIDNKDWKGDGRDVVRCALLCELTNEPVVNKKDTWAGRRLVDAELAEYQLVPKQAPIDLSDRIQHEGFRNLGVERRELLHKGTGGSLDVTKVLKLKKPLPIVDSTCTRFLKDFL